MSSACRGWQAGCRGCEDSQEGEAEAVSYCDRVKIRGGEKSSPFFGGNYLDEIRLKNISLDIYIFVCYTLVTK